ncbi:dipeptidyl aminopeptidase/acylaminoacyl peptidase [Actinoalloteichus fjordicus]|uniref:Dipeptidyl aminopeptidase/acylaminoacyl peptidase n=1 Tax=Actinoalloteichus fjordicus TaxID=1612552 RepID=A0AAC9PSU7_9PSEU|nr:dipeptidyl aminopeptidase/acylaminoacyl peptidase [Actinoalloteichus fjordicus]
MFIAGPRKTSKRTSVNTVGWARLSHRSSPVIGVPAFAAHDSGRAAQIREVDGRPQAVAWDVRSDRHRIVTAAPQGVDLCEIEPDGSHLWWFDAAERGVGRWLRQPFGGGRTTPAMSDVPEGRMYGIAFDHTGATSAVTIGNGEQSQCYLGVPGRQARLAIAATGFLGLVDMTPSGGTLAMAGRPDGPNAVCLRTPEALVQLPGERGRALWPLEFQPNPDVEPELLLAVESAAGYTVATWQPDTGVRRHDWLTFDTEITARWHGPRTVLVQQDRAGRSTVCTVDLDTRKICPVPTPEGTILDLTSSPDGRLHYLWSRTDLAPRLLVSDPDSPATVPEPAGRQREIWTGSIHSFLATPTGAGPWPTVFLVHGGPATHDRDCHDPRVRVFTEAGFAVVRTNYRGSTGYGPAWRRDFGHRVGLAQLDDLAAARAHVIELGVADPDRIGLAGYSWGAYLALLAMGVQPSEWAVAMAAFPVADYPAAHQGTTPALREVDEELFGGTPEEFPERYRAASPMTYVNQVRGSVLLVSSPTDEKCPAEQVERYATALRRRRVPHELVWVGGGHHSRDSADHASVMATMLRFATEVLTPRVPSLPEDSGDRSSP